MSDGASAPVRRRWLGIALFASLAINLLLVGIVVGAMIGGHPRGLPFGGPPRGGPDVVRGGQFGQLSEKTRERLSAIMEDRGDTMRTRVRAMRGAQREAERALSAEPYDADRATAALRTLRQRTEELQAEIHAALAAVAQDLPQHERMRLGRTIFLSTFYGMPLAQSAPPQPPHPHRLG